MNKTIDALNNGKTVYFKSPEPRYYKLIRGSVYYSDNLTSWINSCYTLEIFTIKESTWEVL